MEIDERIKCAMILEEVIYDKLLPSHKLRYIDKVLDEQLEIIIESTDNNYSSKHE